MMACDVSPVVPYLKPDAEDGVLKELKCCEFVEKLFQLDELFRQTVSVSVSVYETEAQQCV